MTGLSWHITSAGLVETLRPRMPPTVASTPLTAFFAGLMISLPSLREYVLIVQDRMQVDVLRVENPGKPERLEKATDCIRLDSIEFSMTLGDLYD